MPIIFQERFATQLREYGTQPESNLEEYQTIPLGIPLSSIQIMYIDGLVWKGNPSTSAESVAGRFWHENLVNKWIIHVEEMSTISGGRANFDRLSSALKEVGKANLRGMSVKTKEISGKSFTAITVSKMARHLIHG